MPLYLISAAQLAIAKDFFVFSIATTLISLIFAGICYAITYLYCRVFRKIQPPFRRFVSTGLWITIIIQVIRTIPSTGAHYFPLIPEYIFKQIVMIVICISIVCYYLYRTYTHKQNSQ